MIGTTRRVLPTSGSPAWVAAETLGSAAFSLVGLLFIARLIGPEAAGIGAIAASAFLTIDFPIAALFGDALMQRRNLEERHRSSALWMTVGVSLIAVLGLFLAAPFIARAIGAPVLTDMIHVLALLLPFSAASGLLAALALRARHYRLLAQRVLICQPLSVGLGMLAATAGWGPWAMVVQQAAATFGVFILLSLLSGWRPKVMFDRAAIADLWPIAGPQILALLVLNGRYRIFILVLGTMVAESVVAVTHIAFRLLDVSMSVVSGASGRLAMPRLSALQHDRDAMAECYGDLAQLQALIGLPIAVGLAITAPQLVTLLMGGAWTAAAEPARLVALAAVPAFLIGPAPALWLALGRTRMNLITQLIAFAVPLTALVIMRPTDAAGAAVCWVGGTLAVVPMQVILGLRALDRPLRWLGAQLMVPIAATLVMAAVALVVAQHVQGKPVLVAISMIGGFGAATYVAMLALLLGGRWPRALREA